MTRIDTVLASLVIALQCAPLASADNCNLFTIKFRPSGDVYYTSLSSRSFIVSRGVVCEGTETCQVPQGGYVTDTRTLNVTLDDDSIFDRISDATEMEFLKDFTGNATADSLGGIRNGTAGYRGFTPEFRCVEGFLYQCEGIANGSGVTACTPHYSMTRPEEKDQNGFRYMDGIFGQVVSDRESVEDLTCNPANTTDAQDGQTVSNCAGNEEITSGASDLEVGNGVWFATASLLALTAFYL